MIKVETTFHRRTHFEFNVEIPSVGITAVFGPSGAGKTTFINLIAGIETPDEGRITVNGTVYFDKQCQHNVPIYRRRVGYVFQDDRLFPHLSVKENLLYSQQAANHHQYDAIVTLLDLNGLLSHYPPQLSGGEKKRVAIARALLHSPEVLLLDEPMSGLDTRRKAELIRYLIKLANFQQVPIVFVSHHLDEIFQLADHMILIDNGKCINYGALSDVWSGKEIRPFINETVLSSLLLGTVVAYHDKYPMTAIKMADGQLLWVNNLGYALGDAVKVNIIAGDIAIAKAPIKSSIRNSLKVVLQGVDKESHQHLVTLELAIDGAILLCNITEWAFDELNLKIGDRCYALIKGLKILAFNCK
ncbi:molybdenum ABC transporter ATP-binding protein [Thaumasiovibrio sp. DFM-14]|uniref:molybdenum ABC transporter ATP-binding protein n=1 Tax=Thaumasiovibrio sp. DFM-14 TaxID=3384792 RepID=UPI0039A3AF61